MNLVSDGWIPVVRSNGCREKIAPWQIAEVDNPVMEVVAPRPDFQGALYQFLIGLLQTVFPPEDAEAWEEYLKSPPQVSLLKSSFGSISTAFELLDTDGAAFLQDFDMPDGEPKNLAALLIEAPGGKTLKDNLDHFVKGGVVQGACESCAATALFTLQTNAPSGGVGHRVGLRGGGPLTTLLVPEKPQSTLWQKLWLNVLTEDEFEPRVNAPLATIFPWLAPTRISDKSGSATLPEDVSGLQMYWGIPRRIRLEASNISGACSLCGDTCSSLIVQYRTKNYGVNYEGPWVHPLTPYRFDPKHVQPPLSLKGQQGGLGYRHWLGLTWQDEGNGDKAALSIQSFYGEKSTALSFNQSARIPVSLWCFGYDMDNMKARCWYEHRIPIVAVPEEYRENFYSLILKLINAAKDVVKELRSQVKAAWFSRPKDVKGDTSMIDQSFWEATEPAFYEQLYALSENPENSRFMTPEVASAWLSVLEKIAFSLFDHWVLEGDAEDMDMKRITRARRFLGVNFRKLKTIKDLQQIASAQTEVA